MHSVTTNWTNNNPNTIHNKLKTKLGREPTNRELEDRVKEILTSVTVDLAGKGKLKMQGKR